MEPNEKILFTIGPYEILKIIGSGGMGEVFLARDTTCGRNIALKRIRQDLLSHKQLHNRFIREARITSQLTHPSIISIYTIQNEEGWTYYTMPYVEGKTLKEILQEAAKRDKKGLKREHSSSIPYLARIYLSICQAVAYAHSRGIIHRDLKPNNIIVGRYGEVVILDWGLAKIIGDRNDEEEGISAPPQESQDLTHLGRVVGTVAFMAPERALGEPASYLSDIYSLGVMLYQILTLKHPFHRGTLKEFRRNIDKEQLYDPAEVAPHRDVPPLLSRIVFKALSPVKEERYQSVDELLHELESYIEGRSEWFEAAQLDVHRKEDWEFQENVLIAEHMAITRSTDISEWVSLMVSKSSFSGNTKIEAKVKIKNAGLGIGFLFSIPEASERVHMNNGYCLWVASDKTKNTKLLRSTVEVALAPETYLEHDRWYQIRIEKIENSVDFYLNDQLQFSYLSFLPLSGTHVGILSRDANFELKDYKIFVGSENITVNCLAIPDAFLSHKQYDTALAEYRRIVYAFPGTAESREALFRAGITLLEASQVDKSKEIASDKIEEALDEFGKLHKTAGAPLEYLGKALVYQVLKDYEEECKCFELAFRRYPKHPLLHLLQEQLIQRMHDTSLFHRKAAYQFILVAASYLPQSNQNANRVFESLKKHWEALFFIEDLSEETPKIQLRNFALQLAFWLGKPERIIELLHEFIKQEQPNYSLVCNALFALMELDEWQAALENMPTTSDSLIQLVGVALSVHQNTTEYVLEHLFSMLPQKLAKQELRTINYLLEFGVAHKQYQLIDSLNLRLLKYEILPENRVTIDAYFIWSLLQRNDWAAAKGIFDHYSHQLIEEDNSPLHFLYGCWLAATQGAEAAARHFSSILQVAFPRSWNLCGHFLFNSVEAQQRWLTMAFPWEKRQLFKQLALYYHCVNDKAKKIQYEAAMEKL